MTEPNTMPAASSAPPEPTTPAPAKPKRPTVPLATQRVTVAERLRKLGFPRAANALVPSAKPERRVPGAPVQVARPTTAARARAAAVHATANANRVAPKRRF